MSEAIKRPYENFYCDKCIFRTPDDMCMTYRLGMSYAYCPRIAACEKFKESDEE
jgi:hypothetical protein